MPENSRDYQSSADYIISSVKLSSGGESLDPIEIRNSVAQLNIYENIERPYLTGEILIVDTSRIYDKFNITGIETCTIELQQPTTRASKITLTFVIHNVMSTTKTNDQTEVMTLKLIEKIAFDNQLAKFSKSYTGNPAAIVSKILEDQLKVAVDGPEILPAQSENMKVVIPFWNPLQAADWVRDRASTKNGLPYFLFKSMNEPNIQLKSLEELLLAPAWNPDNPFKFSKAFTNSAMSLTEIETLFIVENYSANMKENTLELIENGAFSANYDMIDIVSGRRERFNFDIGAFYENLREKNIISKEDVPLISTNYTLNDIPINNLPAKNISRVIMNKTYNGEYVNYYEEDTVANFKLDSVNHAVRNLLTKSSINIRVPGIHFLSGENKSIGRQIEFFYHNNDVAVLDQNNVSIDQLRDRKRSGKFMIYAAKHTFFDTKHTADISAVKLSHQP